MLNWDRSWGGSLYHETRRMQREMNRLFRQAEGIHGSRVYPPINIYDSPEGYRLRAELPGVDPETPHSFRIHATA